MAGSLALGLRIAWYMKGRVLALREMERILGYIEGELRCRHSVLTEALYNVSNKACEPYKTWLLDLIKSVENQCSNNTDIACIKDFYTIWCQALKSLGEKTLLNGKDIRQLCDVGKALGYLDIDSQLMNLNLEREIIHNAVQELDKDISTRMKNIIILCFLGGIMTVIALL